MWDKSGSLREIARIAARQHGAVSIGQLLAAGVSRSTVARWVQMGILHRVHRGVYRVGHCAPSTEADYMAAVLACSPGAALSGHAAAWLFGLVHRPAPPEVSTTKNRRVPDVIVHRVRALPASDVTRWRGIPVTRIPRTLADLAPRVSLDDLALLCHRAEVIHHTTIRNPSHPKLRAIFEGDHALLLSRLEREFRRLLREHGFPLPVTNRKRGGRYVDCRWPEYRLTVELDSYTYHHSRHAWENDRARERAARARGDEFRRYTWRDVCEQPADMLAELRELLPGTVAA